MKILNKNASYEGEIADNMEANFHPVNVEFTNESKHLKALEHINVAAEVLESAGLFADAEMLTDYIEIFASPILDFISNKPEYKEKTEQPKEEISAQEAAKLLRKYHRMAKFLEAEDDGTDEGKEKHNKYMESLYDYLGAVLYLKTVYDKSPRPDIFDRFGKGKIPDWVLQIATLEHGKLGFVLDKHLSSIGSSMQSLENTLLKNAPDFKLSFDEKNKYENTDMLLILQKLYNGTPILLKEWRKHSNLPLNVFNKKVLDYASEAKITLHKGDRDGDASNIVIDEANYTAASPN